VIAMNITELIKTQLIQTYENLVGDLIAAAPKIISGLILILIAWLVAKVVEKAVRMLMVRAKFDSLLGRVGVDTALQQLGLRQSLSNVVPRVVYFLLLFLFARSLADTLGLTAISSAIGTFLAYVPNIVAALLILLVGSALGRFAGAAVARSAEGSGLEFGPALGRALSGVVLFVAVIMAITQLRIDTDIVRLVTALSMAGAALAFGLSFGLGSRTLVSNILAGFYVKRLFEPGTEVEVEGRRGVVTAVSTTSTVLEHEGGELVLANETLLAQTASIHRG
jgi:small-conductance mechanosensitive channel